MNLNELIVLYLIIHLLAVVYVFKMFDHEGYTSDFLDRCIVWLFAPEIVIITLVRMIGGIQ